jgi:urease accessory protein
MDEAATASAHAAPHPLLAVAELAAAMRPTAELALEASQQGVAFLVAVRKAWPHPLLDRLAANLRAAGIVPMLPVAAGMACAAHGITLGNTLPLFLHAGVANLINAAVRLVPLGQTDGQMALAALESAIAETAAEALGASLSDIGSAAFMIDIASMRHETQYTRLFRS